MDDSNNANANAKAPAATTTCADGEQNPTNSPPNGEDAAANLRRRTPFTDLSQVDADLALARTLQEQVLISWPFVFFLLSITNLIIYYVFGSDCVWAIKFRFQN